MWEVSPTAVNIVSGLEKYLDHSRIMFVNIIKSAMVSDTGTISFCDVFDFKVDKKDSIVKGLLIHLFKDKIRIYYYKKDNELWRWTDNDLGIQDYFYIKDFLARYL